MKRDLLTDPPLLSSGESDPSFSSAAWTEPKKPEGKVQLAVVAGLFATIGSLLGKLAGGVELDSVVSNAIFIWPIILHTMNVYRFTVFWRYFNEALIAC